MESLANRIEAVRIEKGLSKTAIWQGAGLTSGVYAQWMNGATLKGDTLVKVANILGVDPNWLQTGKGEKEITHKDRRNEVVIANVKIQSRARLLVDLFEELSENNKTFVEMTVNHLHNLEKPMHSKANPYPSKSKKEKIT